MDQELQTYLDAQNQKLERIEHSLHRIHQYFKWTFIITIALVVLPLLGLAITIPKMLNMFSTMYSGF